MTRWNFHGSNTRLRAGDVIVFGLAEANVTRVNLSSATIEYRDPSKIVTNEAGEERTVKGAKRTLDIASSSECRILRRESDPLILT